MVTKGNLAMHLGVSTKKDYHRSRLPWWYDKIIDAMIANPGAKLADIAKSVGRAESTLSSIINTDLFKSHYQQRRALYAQAHDIGILEKNAQIAHKSLDVILDVLDKKKDQVPLPLLKEIADSTLKRMGYGVDAPAVAVNFNNVNNGQQVILPPTVSLEDLQQAQMAVRHVQEQRAKLEPIKEVKQIENDEAGPTPRLVEG
jgi:hypothetical protein